jgi:YD repeat-containing protein
MFSTMTQSMTPTVSSDIPVPPEGSITIVDPLEDLVHIYTGIPADEYFDFIDVELVSLELTAVEPTLNCTITVKSMPPVDTDNTVWYILMLDENNDPSDNSMDYPYDGIDTMYSIIYTKTGGWTIERAKYQPMSGWFVEATDASLGLASSLPGGFSVDFTIPLTELPYITDTLPWRLMTDTFTYPSTFPETGDFAPDDGLAYLMPTPELVVTTPFIGLLTEPTQSLTGYVLDPGISEIFYRVESMLHEETGTIPVLDGNFSADINLVEGYNLVTISDGVAEATSVLVVDTSAPLVTFFVGSYFNLVDSFNVFAEGPYMFPTTPFTYDMWDEKEAYYEEGPLKGLIKRQERNYYKNGEKIADEHIDFEYYEEEPSKGKVKKKTTTYTDEDGKPVDYFAGGATEYTYDEKGRLVSETYTPTPIERGLTRKYTYEYDEKDRVKKRTEINEDAGKYVGKQVSDGFEYDDEGRVTKYTTRDYWPSGKLDFTVTFEFEYENGKLVKKTVTFQRGKLTLTFVWTYEYDEKGRIIKEVKEEIIPGAEVEKEIITYEYTNGKVKVTKKKNPSDTTVQVSEYRYEMSFPNFTDSDTFSGEVMISDVSSFPMNPYYGMSMVMVSIVNSTGGENTASSELIFGEFFDFNLTLSMNTTVTVTVIDEAGHVGVNTVQIPPPLVTDIDCNNIVNILDITTVAIAFRSYPGHEKWDFFADVNNDDQVNIVDISMVAVDFGKTI